MPIPSEVQRRVVDSSRHAKTFWFSLHWVCSTSSDAANPETLNLLSEEFLRKLQRTGLQTLPALRAQEKRTHSWDTFFFVIS